MSSRSESAASRRRKPRAQVALTFPAVIRAAREMRVLRAVVGEAKGAHGVSSQGLREEKVLSAMLRIRLSLLQLSF